MSDPNSFVNFSDYLGLNEGAGEEMRAKMDAGYTGPREEQLTALEQQHFHDAGANDPAQYATSGEAVRKGLASYGEFLQGMADPTARQALMEKTYGKGAVSALDAAIAGGTSGAKAQINKVQSQAEDYGQRADQRLADTTKGNAMTAAYNKTELGRRQAVADALGRARATSASNDRTRRIDAYGRYRNGAGYDPNGTTDVRDDYNPLGAHHEVKNRDYTAQQMDDYEKAYGRKIGVTANGESTSGGNEWGSI